MPLFHWNHRHPLPFPTLSSETNIEKQYANLGRISNAGRVCQKGMHWYLQQWGAGEKGILGHVLTWIFCGSQQWGPWNNPEGNLASQGVPGSSTEKKGMKLQTTTGLLWGSQIKTSCSSSWKTYMPYCYNLLDLCVLAFRKAFLLFYFFLIWHLSLLYLPEDGMLSMSWGCLHLTLFPRNASLLPTHVQEQSHFLRTLLHPLWIFCLIAGRNQNTENIWRILEGRKKGKTKRRLIKRSWNKC